MQAYLAFQEIKNSAAFNITGAYRRRINQHATSYVYQDGSKLTIFRANKATVTDRNGFITLIGVIRDQKKT